MPAFESLLGQVVDLRLRRLGPPGAFFELEPDDDRTILLPRAEVPPGAREGDTLSLFLYKDSEDRPIATLRSPKVLLGEVAFLPITDVTAIGAFAGWGLAKDLLVPFAEQTRDVTPGERHPIGLYVDDSGRLAGTMRVSELLEDRGRFVLDEWVEGESWRLEPEIGTFVIVERRFVGLVPASEPHRLSRGEAARFRVTHIQPDGKIELSLRGHAHEELADDAARILALLVRPGTPRLGDKSDPEEIRSIFGMSKKAFKRAAGRLLKDGTATIDADGFLVAVSPGSQTPALTPPARKSTPPRRR
jgi:predicted RNA-binding protein (virulence factor B family)